MRHTGRATEDPAETGRSTEAPPPAGAPRDPHAPLRDDVRLLGRLLGDTVREQAGAAVFDRVEAVRRSAKAGRGGDQEAPRALGAALAELPVEEAVPVARGFAQFLTLANIAEQHHRVRRRRDHQRDPEAPPQRASLEETFRRLIAEGVDPDHIVETLLQMDIELVFTAHPTEITRRTLLRKHQRVAALLADADRSDLTPVERTELETALKREIVAIWRTDEIRHKRPTPEDEAKGGYAVVEQILWDAVPRYMRELDRVLRHHTGNGLPLEAAPVRFGSWMGGDRDGNPNVTPEVTLRVVLLARWLAVDLFEREVDALRNELSMTECTEAVRARVGPVREPYRALLREVRDTLRRTRDHIEALLDDRPGPEGPLYAERSDLEGPLRLVYDSLHATGAGTVADGALLDILRRLAVFGLHLLRIDLRQESVRHTEALDAVTRHLGVGSYAEWDEAERVRFLLKELQGRRPLVPNDLDAPAEVHDVLDTLRTAARIPRTSLGAYVISMARRPSDVLAVHLLQRECGLSDPLPVVPLFETLDDLQHAGETMQALLALPWYRATVAGGTEVMIGYSDSAKDAGVLAAAWALYQAQERLCETFTAAGVPLTLFHGRGGSVGRGGGPAHQAVRALPPGSVAGRLRVTEQGEVIQNRFGQPGIALRTLEVYTTAVLEATLLPSDPPKAAWRELMEEMAEASCRAYRRVVRETEGFVDYFRAATPEVELGLLNIGSRPQHRRPSGGIESLRAIPWVFAWTQNRLILPGWLGVGEGLQTGRVRDAGRLAEMVQEWPFLRTTLDQIEMVLAKADLWIAGQYDAVLVPDRLRPLGAHLHDSFQTTVQEHILATGRARLLERNPVLERSIAVRNPYVDPLNLLQVEFLRRVRSEKDDRLHNALLVTVNGVAQGMRNTG